MINKLFKSKSISTSDLTSELLMLREENKRYIVFIYFISKITRKNVLITNMQEMFKTKISEVFKLKTVIHTILLV